MASPIPTKGSPVESHDTMKRATTDVVSVKPASPLAAQFRQQTGTSDKAEIETADGEWYPDFYQESDLLADWSERRGLKHMTRIAIHNKARDTYVVCLPHTENFLYKSARKDSRISMFNTLNAIIILWPHHIFS